MAEGEVIGHFESLSLNKLQWAVEWVLQAVHQLEASKSKMAARGPKMDDGVWKGV